MVMGVRTWWRERGRPTWQTIRWPFLGGLAVLALLLGYLGFREHFRLTAEERSPLGVLYLSLQLFTMESGSIPPPIPWTLEVARLLAPLVALSAAVTALALVLSDQMAAVRLRRMKDHVVVCGLGRKGALLVRGFRARGTPVVAIEHDETEGAIRECREAGAVVLVGDATDEAILRRARTGRARYVLAVCGEDGANADIIVHTRRLARGRAPGQPIRVFAHIVDVELCNLLRMHELAAGSGGATHVEFFNVYEAGARIALAEHPPGEHRHIVVVGCGQMGRSLIVQAARMWQLEHRDGEPLRVSVVDRVASAKTALLVARHPGLERVCDLRPVDEDIRSATFVSGGFVLDADGRAGADAAYVCVDDAALGLWAGMALVHASRGTGTPVVVRVSDRTGLESLLEPQDRRVPGFEHLVPFPLLERTCTPELLLSTDEEVLARAIHEDYVRNRRLEGDTPATNPSLVPWDQLPESLRESNRRQAQDVGAKLEAVGCGLEPFGGWDDEPLTLAPPEVELLARMEHDRWMRDLLDAGWRFAPPPKDAERRTSPYLVPWDEIPEQIKEYDREAVRGMPGFLARAGFRARRLPEVSDDAEARADR
jgi:hypothetical protein